MRKTIKSKDEKALNKAIDSATTVPKCAVVHPEAGNINSEMRTTKEIEIAEWLMRTTVGLNQRQANYIASSFMYGAIPHTKPI